VQRKKANTRSYTNVLIRRGKIDKEPCRSCGDPNAQAHHPDYNDPRRVEWMCRRCHKKHHEAEVAKDKAAIRSFLYK
jgi:site-specific recombinase XerC